MSTQLTADDFKQSLNAHVAARGEELREKYGPRIGWDELMQILEDRAFCRYPCEIRFDAGPLLSGEFAFPEPKGDRPEEGFTLFVHPCHAADRDHVPLLALYQLVLVNYGEFASSDDAETFGACALGMAKSAYYQALCEMADQCGSGPALPGTACACGKSANLDGKEANS